MNCEQIVDFMPLYAAGDLEERHARFVAAHVQICESCLGAVREYRETRQLLQTFAPPEFTETFYTEIRRSVWQNIEQKPSLAARSNMVAGLFRPSLAWALATAVLIAVSLVGIYMISRRKVVPPLVVTHQPPKSPATHDKQPAASLQNDPTAAGRPTSGSNSRSANVHQPDLQQKRKTTHDRVTLAVVPTVAAVLPAASSAPEFSNSGHPIYGSSDALRGPLRMEIQTKNPNIRIIWFAPREAKQASPNSKGI